MQICSKCNSRIGFFEYDKKTFCYYCIIDQLEDEYELSEKQYQEFQRIKINEDHFNEISKQLSKEFQIDLEQAQEELIRSVNYYFNKYFNTDLDEETSGTTMVVKQKNKKKNRALDVFGTNLVEKMRNSEQLLIGRDDVIQNTLRILQRKFKNNPLIIGEPGTGKTAIVEGIAKLIAEGKVDSSFKNKEIISIDVADLLAGTKLRGDLEKRLKQIIKEATEDENVILFIDEFHTLLSNYNDLSIAQMLKPFLARGELQIIGTTTLDEYRKYIEKDSAFDRRVQKVMVKEPTEQQTIEIIKGIKHQFENYHKVHIDNEVIEEAVYLTKRYLPNRFFPDKAIDLIDEAAAHKKMLTQQDKYLTKIKNKLKKLEAKREQLIEDDDIDGLYNLIKTEKELKNELNKASFKLNFNDLGYILEKWTGIPANRMNKENLSELNTLQDRLKERVKGQDEAIEIITKAVRRSKVGLNEENKPLGSFLFLGPTGVGKTELAKALAECLFGDEKYLIRIDMSEYMEKHSISKLIGSPPGYVGYEDEGILTIKLRENPYSVVLFDEFEKAHPDVQKVLLQLLDEGRITNASGLTVDAKNCYFIMTSNIGSEFYHSKKTPLGFNSQQDLEKNIKESVIEEVKKVTRPEFFNRLDSVVVFNNLNKDTMLDIAKKFTNELINLTDKKGYELKFTFSALNLLAEKGFEPEYGARPMKRLLNEIKDLIADAIIENPDKKSITVGAKKINENKEFYIK